jgi:hypothetical protein
MGGLSGVFPDLDPVYRGHEGVQRFVDLFNAPWEELIPDARPYRGHQGYADWLADWGAAWSGFSVEAERWLDAGDKVVLVLKLTARGRASGVEVKRRDAMVLTARDRKSIRIDYYKSEAQALEAVGLLVQGAHAADS